jgi:hypothetical protein
VRQIIYINGTPEVGTHQYGHVRDWLEDNGISPNLVPMHSEVYVEDGIVHYEQYTTVDAEGYVHRTDFAKPVSFPWDGA